MIFYGERLVQARQSRGLSRRDLSAAIHVPVATIRKWERNEATPRVSILTGLDEYGSLVLALGYPGRFYRMPPSPPLGPTSLDWHLMVYECDRCNEPIDRMLLEHPEAREHYHPGCTPQAPVGGGV